MDSETNSAEPPYVTELAKAYGGPSQNAFGSAVFFQPTPQQAEAKSLEQFALAKYQYFCGETWERFGASNWLDNWAQVYERLPGTKADIAGELNSLSDINSRSAASLLLDPTTIPNGAQSMTQAFDDTSVSEMRVFKIGDGAAMSGVLIAANRPEGTCCLLILLD